MTMRAWLATLWFKPFQEPSQRPVNSWVYRDAFSREICIVFLEQSNRRLTKVYMENVTCFGKLSGPWLCVLVKVEDAFFRAVAAFWLCNISGGVSMIKT